MAPSNEGSDTAMEDIPPTQKARLSTRGSSESSHVLTQDFTLVNPQKEHEDQSKKIEEFASPSQAYLRLIATGNYMEACSHFVKVWASLPDPASIGSTVSADDYKRSTDLLMYLKAAYDLKQIGYSRATRSNDRKANAREANLKSELESTINKTVLLENQLQDATKRAKVHAREAASKDKSLSTLTNQLTSEIADLNAEVSRKEMERGTAIHRSELAKSKVVALKAYLVSQDQKAQAKKSILQQELEATKELLRAANSSLREVQDKHRVLETKLQGRESDIADAEVETRALTLQIEELKAQVQEKGEMVQDQRSKFLAAIVALQET